MSIAVVVLLLIVLALTVIGFPLVFDIGYECGKTNALRKVSTEIPKGLSEEQHAWIGQQMESR